MADYAVVRGCFDRTAPFMSVAGSDGFEVFTAVSRATGSHHVELAICRLQPDGYVNGHLHHFEESFYILDGEALLAIDAQHHALSTDDFGFVPVSAVHAWRNTSDRPVTWYRIAHPSRAALARRRAPTRWPDSTPRPQGRRPVRHIR